jgi:hypothetical protein
MFDDDQMTDSAGLRELRDSLTGVAAVFMTGAAAGSVLTLALVGGPGGAPVHGSTPESTHGTIRTAAYTLISDTSGTVKLTINPKKLFDAAALQSDLARFGRPRSPPPASARRIRSRPAFQRSCR